MLSDRLESQRPSSQESRVHRPSIRSIDRPKLSLRDFCRFVALIWSSLFLQVLLYLRSSWASRWREVWYLVFPITDVHNMFPSLCVDNPRRLMEFTFFLVSGRWSSWECRVEVQFFVQLLLRIWAALGEKKKKSEGEGVEWVEDGEVWWWKPGVDAFCMCGCNLRCLHYPGRRSRECVSLQIPCYNFIHFV